MQAGNTYNSPNEDVGDLQQQLAQAQAERAQLEVGSIHQTVACFQAYEMYALQVVISDSCTQTAQPYAFAVTVKYAGSQCD